MVRKKEVELSKNFQEARELIKDKEKLFDAIMNAIGDGITIQDLDMRIVYQNKFLVDMFGDHTGEYCYRIYERRDKICKGCPIQTAYKNGKVHKALRVGIDKEGRSFRFENIASALRNKQGKIVVGIEITKMVEEREKAKKEFQKKIRELEEFSKIAVERRIRALDNFTESAKETEELMEDLKKEVNGLLVELGRPPKYKIYKSKERRY